MTSKTIYLNVSDRRTKDMRFRSDAQKQSIKNNDGDEKQPHEHRFSSRFVLIFRRIAVFDTTLTNKQRIALSEARKP